MLMHVCVLDFVFNFGFVTMLLYHLGPTILLRNFAALSVLRFVTQLYYFVTIVLYDCCYIILLGCLLYGWGKLFCCSVVLNCFVIRFCFDFEIRLC